jgi:metal-responsive CopG/Arc/MetJ family transcriptional regulator
MADGGDDPLELRVRLDDPFRMDLEKAAMLTGIRGRSDLVRHAIRMLVHALEPQPAKGRGR